MKQYMLLLSVVAAAYILTGAASAADAATSTFGAAELWSSTKPVSASGSAGLLSHEAEMFRVISVIEKRVGDRRLLEKAKDKLTAMNDTRLRLAVSLSDRAADNGNGVDADIAFLLLTTLIIFS